MGLSELRKMSKEQLIDKCRKVELDNLTIKKINKVQKREWFKTDGTEETKMAEQFELRTEFRKVNNIPSHVGKGHCSETIEKLKQNLSTMLIGDIFYVPINEMYAEYAVQRRKSICSQYNTKLRTAMRHLEKVGLYEFKISKRKNELYIQRTK